MYKTCFFTMILLSFLLISTVACSNHFFDNLYCGRKNCYEILNVKRDDSRSVISKSYRNLAKKTHPDRFLASDAKAEAAERFKEIANAYEILKDEDQRADYDFMLDNPDKFYAHYYRYYRRRLSPKVDVRIVIAVVISVISGVQYWRSHQNYAEAISFFAKTPKYRNQAISLAESMNLWPPKQKLSKSDQRRELESIVKQLISDRMDIKGAYAKPEWKNVLWVQLLLFPYYLFGYLMWNWRWFWSYVVKREDYRLEDKLYLIRRNLGYGKNQFAGLDQKQKDEFLQKRLWRNEEFAAWKRIEEEKAKKALADNPRYKAYRRYIKNHGNSRMTFVD